MVAIAQYWRNAKAESRSHSQCVQPLCYKCPLCLQIPCWSVCKICRVFFCTGLYGKNCLYPVEMKDTLNQKGCFVRFLEGENSWNSLHIVLHFWRLCQIWSHLGTKDICIILKRNIDYQNQMGLTPEFYGWEYSDTGIMWGYTYSYGEDIALCLPKRTWRLRIKIFRPFGGV